MLVNLVTVFAVSVLLFVNLVQSGVVRGGSGRDGLQAKVETLSIDDVKHLPITVNGRPINETEVPTAETTADIFSNDVIQEEDQEEDGIPHNITLGEREDGDILYYTDNTIVENSGPSTISGTFEINIDAPMRITRVEVWDQLAGGLGGYPSFPGEGGLGHNHVTLEVRSQYTKGFHFLVHVYGVPSDVKDPDGIAANILNTL